MSCISKAEGVVSASAFPINVKALRPAFFEDADGEIRDTDELVEVNYEPIPLKGDYLRSLLPPNVPYMVDPSHPVIVSEETLRKMLAEIEQKRTGNENLVALGGFVGRDGKAYVLDHHYIGEGDWNRVSVTPEDNPEELQALSAWQRSLYIKHSNKVSLIGEAHTHPISAERNNALPSPADLKDHFRNVHLKRVNMGFAKEKDVHQSVGFVIDPAGHICAYTTRPDESVPGGYMPIFLPIKLEKHSRIKRKLSEL